MHSKNVFVALLCGASLSSCVVPKSEPCECATQDAGSCAAPDAGTDAGVDAGQPPPVEQYSLRYELQLDPSDAGLAIRNLPTSLHFRGASGLSPYDHALPDLKGDPDAGRQHGRGWTDLHLSAADGPGFDALRRWRQELGKVAICPDDGSPCDPEGRWKGEAPPFLLPGKLVVRTETSNTPLVTYHFKEAWPSSLLGVENPDGGSSGSGVTSLSLTTCPDKVVYDIAHPLIDGLKPVYRTGRFDPLVLDLRGDGKRLGRTLGLEELEDAIDEAWSHPEAKAIRAVGKHKGDYLPAHNFKIEIDGVISGGFKEVTGLESEIEVIEYKDGDDPITHKRAGKAKYKNIVLKRGLATDDTLHGLVLDFPPEAATQRKSGSIILHDREHTEVVRYGFFEAWPVRWKAPELNSGSDTHLVEEIEFVVEKVERN